MAKTTPKFDPEKASKILAEAEIFGDAQTCKRWDVSRVTLYRYRVRAQDDGSLNQLVILKKRMLLISWQTDVSVAVKVTVGKIKDVVMRAEEFLDNEDPEQGKKFASILHAISGAGKILGELKLAGEALDESGSSSEVPETQARSR